MVGICNRCHHRVHQNRLVITRDGSGGFVFTRRNGRVIDDHAKVTKQRVREIIALIRQAAARPDDSGGPSAPPAQPATQPPTHEDRSARQLRIDSQWLTPLSRDRSSPSEERLYEFIGHHT